MSALVVVPVVLPLLTAVTLLALPDRPTSPISVLSGGAGLGVALALLLAASGGDVQAVALGGWGARVGIVWAVDLLSAIMLVLASTVSLATLVYAPATFSQAQRPPSEARFHAVLHQLLLAGVMGAFLTADLFNLFVFFEVMLVASFALISLGGRARQLQRVFPYVLVNLVASALFLGGVGAVYGTAGTVNLAVLSLRVAESGLSPAFYVAMPLVLLVFAIKAALVPVFTWLPDAYPEASVPVSALFAGLLTKVGVYALYRVIPLLSGGEPGPLQAVLLPISVLTMGVGVVGALGRSEIRSVLSFHVISQVGYMIFGLAIFSPLAVAAGIFYVVHHILVKTALFFAGGLAEAVGGSGKLGDVRGLATTHPWIAVGFFVPAMALAGLPPFSGFWGKLFLIVGGFRAEAWISTAAAVLVSLLTLASMLKIWVATFWGAPAGQRHPERGRDPGMLGATLALGACSVAVGIAAPPLFALSERAAHQLLATTPYVEAVTAAGRRP